MRKILAMICLTLAMQTAWAIDIRSAKDQGLVGETTTGYLAAVKTPVSADVKPLINSVTAKRKTQFSSTANKTNTTIDQVSHRFYELAVQKTAAGHYYQDANGNWKKK